MVKRLFYPWITLTGLTGLGGCFGGQDQESASSEVELEIFVDSTSPKFNTTGKQASASGVRLVDERSVKVFILTKYGLELVKKSVNLWLLMTIL
jgi:hypothetical protein